jgi:hypothetical protein
MGAGIGEAIVVHVGGGYWFIVDSCKDLLNGHTNNVPAPLRYLREMGVNVETNVSTIVATHWDSDHVGGLGDLVEACKSASFCCANALIKREFTQYRERLMTGSAATNGAQVRDFTKVIDICETNGRLIKWAGTGRELLVWPENILTFGKKCTLRSLSPSDEEFNLFLEEILGDMPNARQSKRSATCRTPNLASIVLHIDWEGSSVLLGADMETHSNIRRGWPSVIKDAQDRNLSKAEVYKVAHHGSHNGHVDQMWSDLLVPSPVAMLTPYLRGRIDTCPPTDSDIERIVNLAPRSFITTQRYHDDIKRPVVINSGLSEEGITMKNRRRPMGIVRFRKKQEKDALWLEELFGAACHLNMHANNHSQMPHFL